MSRKKKRGSSGDPLRVQISVKIRKPKGVRITRDFLDEVLTNWAENDGELPPGIEVTAVHFQNPDRTTPTTAYKRPGDWRHATTPDQVERARTSLNTRGLLRPGTFSIQTVGGFKRGIGTKQADDRSRPARTSAPRKPVSKMQRKRSKPSPNKGGTRSSRNRRKQRQKGQNRKGKASRNQDRSKA